MDFKDYKYNTKFGILYIRPIHNSMIIVDNNVRGRFVLLYGNRISLFAKFVRSGDVWNFETADGENWLFTKRWLGSTRIPATSSVISRISKDLPRIVQSWAVTHPDEISEAHRIWCNNEIICANAVIGEISESMKTMKHLLEEQISKRDYCEGVLSGGIDIQGI